LNIAIIPARGGSKRIPRKNIKQFCGQPMIAWSIQAAIDSGCFDRVLVSTDDDEIAAVALKYGAEVPFLRPAELADDYCATVPVIQHAIQWLEHRNERLEFICCLYATAPFIQAADLKLGYQTLANEKCDFAFSVTHFDFPIQRGLWLTGDNRIEMIQPENMLTRSQDLQEAFHDAGQFYWGVKSAWLSGKDIFGEESTPIILPSHRVQDIDTQEDWLRAEMMFRILLQHKKEKAV